MEERGQLPTRPPVAKRVPEVSQIHGETRVDDYFWMRDKENPEVAAYLEAENAYTEAVMKPTEGFQETLYKEMLARVKETDHTVPYRRGKHFYYSRTMEGEQYPIHCRKRGSLDAAEEIVLDLNAMAAGLQFLAVEAHEVSDDGNRLAFTTDTTGFRVFTLNVKDLTTGQILPDRREDVDTVAWAMDSETFFYTVKDAAKRPYRLYRHRIGSSAPDLLYEERDERFEIVVSRTRSKAFLLLHSVSRTTSEVRYLPADQPEGEWQLVSPREPDHEYYVDHHGDSFYIRTNSGGRNFRLVTAPVSDPRRENWRELVPHRPEVMLEGMEFFADHYVLREREGGLPHLRVAHIRSGASYRIPFPEPAYTVAPEQNREFETTKFRYEYQSLVTPPSVFDYDMNAQVSQLLKQKEVLGGFDPGNYTSERVYAASDGTRIPISMVYRRGFRRDGSHPLYLVGYGSYGLPMPVVFDSNRFSLVDRGVVVALAHVRGGGDLGKAWHDQGRMLQKGNTFADFIAVAEHLIHEKYTSRDRLAIGGGSAGGLLMGAVVNLRPDLFKAVLSVVPFVDVINTMLDASLPLTVTEYEEWGNPNLPQEYASIRSYSPYDNLVAKDYPAMLVKTSFHDSQVMYWEPAKYVAKLRRVKTDRNPLLFKINMAAGHGGSSGRYDFLREIAFNYAFLLGQLAFRR